MRSRFRNAASDRPSAASSCVRLALGLAISVAWPFAARAQPTARPCGRAGSPWVAVAFRGEALAAAEQRAVVLDLRAGLQLAGIETCTLGTEGSEPPLAVLELVSSEPSRVLVSIEVHDALTKKRVLRDIDMTDVAVDARPLAIAVAAEELLRASWVELALQDAPEPSRPPPVEVTRVIGTSLAPAQIGRRDHAVGARFAAEHFTGGLSQLGADAYALLWLDEHLGLEAGAGMRNGLQHDATHGSIESQALVAHADLAWAPIARDHTSFATLKLGVQLSSLHVRGIADDRSDGARAAGIAVHARASIAGSIALSPWLAITAEIGAGLPLRAIEAADDGRVAVSNGGLGLHGGAGLEARF